MSKGSKPRPTGPQYSANYDAIQWTTKPRCLECYKPAENNSRFCSYECICEYQRKKRCKE